MRCTLTPQKVTLTLAIMALAGLLAGCDIDIGAPPGPYAVVNGHAYGARMEPAAPPPPPVQIGNIPPGPEHDVCRQELNKAAANIDQLQRELNDCRYGRAGEDQALRDEANRLRVQRDHYRQESEYWRNRYEQSAGR